MKEHIQSIQIGEFDYSLPEEKIAKYPIVPRHNSNLLIYKRGEIFEDQYLHLPNYLPENSHLVFNQTKVIQARLKFWKNEQTTIEVFCLEPPMGTDIQSLMSASSPVTYRCLIGGARKWKSGKLHLTTADGLQLSVEKLENLGGDFLVRFEWDKNIHFADMLEKAGSTPLPPYIRRDAEDEDQETYQTIYALNEGSVAAPTAGLHFTDELMQQLDLSGTSSDYLTLHVGAGTFKPVSADEIGGHEMHAEEFFPDIDLLESLRSKLDKRIIAVGTTSMRAMESIYWLGAKILKNGPESKLEVNQWEPYEMHNPPRADEALDALIDHLNSLGKTRVKAKTSLIIAPGYVHRICRGLLTNFHQPRSTLLLLVASLVGDEWKRIYQYALKHDFRFLSYGDGCLILKD